MVRFSSIRHSSAISVPPIKGGLDYFPVREHRASHIRTRKTPRLFPVRALWMEERAAFPGKAVLLEAAVGFVGDGAFDQA